MSEQWQDELEPFIAEQLENPEFRAAYLRGLMIDELEGLPLALGGGQVVALNEELAAHIVDQLLTAKSLAAFIPAACTCPPGRDDFRYGSAGTHHNPRCPLWMIP